MKIKVTYLSIKINRCSCIDLLKKKKNNKMRIYEVKMEYLN